MANGRGDRTRVDRGRDPGRFIGLPVSVVESAAYLGLSANARSLLLEVAYQFHGDDNGRMLLSRAYLKKRGWNSSDMIDKGKRELLDADLIFETVKGYRPNKASWYAVTWRKLDKLNGFDAGVEKAFRQSAYRQVCAPSQACRGTRLSPPGGTETDRIGPPSGPEIAMPVPQRGTIGPIAGVRAVPPHGHPLEKPSPAGEFGCAVH